MIRTKLADDVPATWVFEYYCGLQESLHGQDIKIKSVFNPTERTASMSIYFKNGEYKFTDFSTGRYGNAVDLVMQLFNLSPLEAHSKMAEDFNAFSKSGYKLPTLIEESRFQVSSVKTRTWNELDAKFWTAFGIGSSLLEFYNVRPLESFTMSKNTEDGVIEIVTKSQYVYGYFKSNGELYKVYQPKRTEFKFMNIQSYVQGSEQLSYSKPTLIICSSLKDIMSLMTLGFDVEAIAPNSENTTLPKAMITALMCKYKKVLTLFDNDRAGELAMNKYEHLFGIPGIYLNMSKDLSDSVRDFGIDKTRQCLRPLIINS